jgi:hypothetical protein
MQDVRGAFSPVFPYLHSPSGVGVSPDARQLLGGEIFGNYGFKRLDIRDGFESNLRAVGNARHRLFEHAEIRSSRSIRNATSLHIILASSLNLIPT